MRTALTLAGLLTLLPPALVLAQQGEPVDAPPPPPPVQSGEVLEPDITIIEGEERTIFEYRMNGQLYMVKIVPKVGQPYYLIDHDGNGSLETRRPDIDENMMVPTWMILRF
jgi:hypothetical protein